MKLILKVVILGLITGLTALPAAAQNVQLLQNGGFESWTVNGPSGPPDDWFLGTSGFTATQGTAFVHSGSYSTELTWTQTGTLKFASDTMQIVPNQNYTCSLWVYDTTTSGRVRMWFWYIPVGLSPSPNIPYSVDTAGWKLYTYTTTAPSGANRLQMEIRMYAQTWTGSAKVWVDDMVLWGPEPVANQPPLISQVYYYPYPTVYAGDTARVRAIITDDFGLVADSLFIRRSPQPTFAAVGADSVVGSYHWYTIGPNPAGTLVEYYVWALDDSGATAQSATYSFTVQDTTAPPTAIYTIQFNNTNVGGTPPDTCYPSPLWTQVKRITGKVTAVYQEAGEHARYWVQDADSFWSGIFVYGGFNSPDTVQLGDSITVAGIVSEYYGVTELTSPTGLIRHTTNRPLYPPKDITAAVLGSTGCDPIKEKYEGMLVKIDSFLVTSYVGSPQYSYWGTDGSGDSCAIWTDVYFNGYSVPTIQVGSMYDITGVVHYVRGQYRIAPRIASDVRPPMGDTTCSPANTIYQVQYSTNQGIDTSCFISPLEGQVVELCGRVTAVQQDTTAPYYWSFYIQDNSNPTPGDPTWSGIYIYDFSVDTVLYKVNIGDKVLLSGRVKEYWGWTEIDSLVSFAFIDTIGRVRPQPLDVRVIDLINGCSFFTEPYENILVKIDSVTVLSGLGGGKFWIKDNSTTDSIIMDDDLWIAGGDQPVPVPSTGAQYQSVTGVVKYEGRTYVTAPGEYYLLPAKASDYVPLTVPQANAVAAWPTDNTHMTVLFDRAMGTPSASNYTIKSGIAVIDATLDPNDKKRVHLTTGTQGNGIGDTLIVQGAVDSLGIVMTVPDSVRFWQGFTPIAKIQTPASYDTTAPSAMFNEVVTIKGVLTVDTSSYYHSPGNTFYIEDYSDSVMYGVQLYLPPPQAWLGSYWPAIGDTIVVTAHVNEYFGETELDYVSTYKHLRLINSGPIPQAAYVSSNPADHRYNAPASQGERLEGVLCKLIDTLIVGVPGVPDPYTHWLISQSTGDTISFEGQDAHRRYTVPPTGSKVVNPTGVHRWRRGAWRLVPRFDADFTVITGAACEYVVGDINGDDQVRGSDVTYGVRYFKGLGPQPPDSCYDSRLPGNGYLYVAGDVNGNCEFRGSDITRLVAYFKGSASLVPCGYFPPPLLLRPADEESLIRQQGKVEDTK